MNNKRNGLLLQTKKQMNNGAIVTGLGFVLSTFVYFPSMAPFQHFCNVLGAVFLGPWYNFAAALLTGSRGMVLCPMEQLETYLRT